MLRVGLTGGLGSGKSTVAAMLAKLGAHVLSADEIGRELMQPGQAVWAGIVGHFGPAVVAADGTLDRAALARIAFEEGRVEELNAIVHPETIARQAALTEAIFARDHSAVVVVESALIFETQHGGDGGWRRRFDRMILVSAPDEAKVARFVERSSRNRMSSVESRAELASEARRRLARQIDDEAKASQCDFVLTNDGSMDDLKAKVAKLWPILEREAEGT